MQSPVRRPADAVVFAFLFRTASGAAAGLSVLKPSAAGRERGTRNLPAKALGDRSIGWYEPGGANGNESASYLWRTRNLVILARVVCDTECGFPVVTPARTYAYAIDAHAKRS